MRKQQRTIKFTLRLTAAESAELEIRSLSRKQDKADYVRRRIFGADTPPVPELNYLTYEELTKLRQELTRWGVNLNQLAHHANSNLPLRNIKTELAQIDTQISRIAKNIKALQVQCLGVNRGDS